MGRMMKCQCMPEARCPLETLVFFTATHEKVWEDVYAKLSGEALFFPHLIMCHK